MKKLVALALCAALGVLWIPAEAPAAPAPSRASFLWGQGAMFSELETEFAERGALPCAGDDGPPIALAELTEAMRAAQNKNAAHDDPIWVEFQEKLFSAAVLVAACPEHAVAFSTQLMDLREALRWRAQDWNLRDPGALATLYRLQYGARAAFEEVVLQTKNADLTLQHGNERLIEGVPLHDVHGVRIQSGDILVSRGGAPTSALIARGNDRPGNFSHVALVYVDEQGKAFVIESHIESGVGVFSAEQYLKDKKLRIMLLRLRPDHPALKDSRDLPHRAALHALKQARREPSGYDFAMDYQEPSRMFCSEVVYHAYRSQNVLLWKALSSLSSPSSGKWLAALGVKHFETLAPSDLEYDPQLRVVAEWRNPETLLDDHIDNAIIDALLDRAASGMELDYDVSKLGLARLAKAYSFVLNQVGKQGPIPEGMGADTALRVDRLRELHSSLDVKVREGVRAFEQERGYLPPYWELVRIAEQHAASL